MTAWISCREFLDFLWAYLDGEISETEKKEFEYHLSGCPSCVAYLNSYKETIALGKNAFQETEEVPDEVPEELVRAVLAARRPKPN